MSECIYNALKCILDAGIQTSIYSQFHLQDWSLALKKLLNVSALQGGWFSDMSLALLHNIAVDVSVL